MNMTQMRSAGTVVLISRWGHHTKFKIKEHQRVRLPIAWRTHLCFVNHNVLQMHFRRKSRFQIEGAHHGIFIAPMNMTQLRSAGTMSRWGHPLPPAGGGFHE